MEVKLNKPKRFKTIFLNEDDRFIVDVFLDKSNRLEIYVRMKDEKPVEREKETKDLNSSDDLKDVCQDSQK